MLDLERDIKRLEMILDDCGLERYSTSTRLQDLLSYFFSRFLKNIQNVFKEFSHSELEDFLMRHPEKTNLLFKDPFLNLSDTIFPIPKGMLQGYKPTCDALNIVIQNTDPVSIASDIQTVIDATSKTEVKPFKTTYYIKSSFDSDAKTIGRMFSSNGLTHTTGQKAFSSVAELGIVKDDILKFARVNYPQVFDIHEKVKHLEKLHSEDLITGKSLDILRQNILSLGYRISIFSKAMTHVHEMEHAFVKGLTYLIQSKR